jgi:hypothetical protein
MVVVEEDSSGCDGQTSLGNKNKLTASFAAIVNMRLGVVWLPKLEPSMSEPRVLTIRVGFSGPTLPGYFKTLRQLK